MKLKPLSQSSDYLASSHQTHSCLANSSPVSSSAVQSARFRLPNVLPVRLLGGVLGSTALLLSWGSFSPASALERLNLKFGPFEQSVAVDDLEHFADTGELSSDLKPYGLFLNDNVRQVLSNRLSLDPETADAAVARFLDSKAGEQALTMLQEISPDLSVETLQFALVFAAQQFNGISLLEILKAVPQDELTLDVNQTIAIVKQLDFAAMQESFSR